MIRVFVGCAANGEDIESQIVLESSLRRYCSRDIQITWMKLSKEPGSPFAGWRTDLWSTPFSGFRWAVPELCEFEGRAIYMDSDIIARADITELWDTPIDIGKCVVAKGGEHSWRFCVALWDCSLARKYLPNISAIKQDPNAHRSLMLKFKTSNYVQPFSNGNWNCIDGEDYKSIYDPDIKLLHYSSESHQPHLKFALPRLYASKRKHWFDGKIKDHWREDIQKLFNDELFLAFKHGYDIDDYEPKTLYGDYVKKTEKNYRSHQWAR